MLISSLSLHNFMGYRKPVTLHFPLSGKIGIIGNNESGKSTLAQAISYLLWGKTRTSSEMKLINDHADGDMLVEGAVELPGKKLLQITRGRTRKNESILKVHGRRGKSSELHQYILDQIALSYKDFIGLSYFAQGDIHQLMTGNKREYFNRWTSGLKTWSFLESEANSWLKLVENKQLNRREKIDELESIAAQYNDLLNDFDELDAERKHYTVRIRKIENKLINKKAELKAKEDVADLMRTAEGVAIELEEFKNDYNELGVELFRAKKDIEKLESGICPLLNLECNDLLDTNEKIKTKLITRQNKLSKDKRRLLKRIKEKSILEKDLSNQLKECFDYEELENEIGTLKADMNNYKRKIDHTNIELSKLKVSINTAKKAEKEIVELNSEYDKSNRLLSRLKFVKHMCSKSGIPQNILEGELIYIENKCNWVLERLGYKKRISFKSFMELAGYEKICPFCGGSQWHKKACSNCGELRPHTRKDEPTISVIDKGVERSFDLESGGAQTLQSFSVRLAYSLFVNSMSGVPLELLILDEVFAHLDKHNEQRLMNLIVGKLATEFGLKQIFVISHHTDVINAVDYLLQIKNIKGESVATWL